MLKKITKWETEDGKVFDTQEEAEDYMFEQEKEVMTHTSTEQPEALRLAEYLEMVAPNECKALIVNSAAQELRLQHARVQELEAEKARLIEAYVPCPSATEAYMYGITQEKQG